MEKVENQEVEKKYQISFSIRLKDRTYFVSVKNIAFIYLDEKTVYLVDFRGKKHIVSKTLETLESLISTQQFYRINRQMIINRQAIKDVAPHTNQRIVVHLNIPKSSQALIPRMKVKPFLAWIEKG
jgi:two-component system, LytTR family, response regulator LytT